ncbi:hypothetical protein [Vibrio xiamenensis]|uniref:hypothetical protein n=1 Tax=Vibrio xiamenensis TaxID=861298 RepID=UPI00115F8ACA|nr:hypothetical protein [Vibrio xiamenensis]
MKWNVFLVVWFALCGFLFRLFLQTGDTRFPLEPTTQDYLDIMHNDLALPYLMIGAVVGVFASFIVTVVRKTLSTLCRARKEKHCA